MNNPEHPNHRAQIDLSTASKLSDQERRELFAAHFKKAVVDGQIGPTLTDGDDVICKVFPNLPDLDAVPPHLLPRVETNAVSIADTGFASAEVVRRGMFDEDLLAGDAELEEDQL